MSFNYLHVIFLILRLKIFYSGTEEQYVELYHSLPKTLNAASREFKNFFKKAFKNPDKFTPEEIAELRNLIETRIIDVESLPNIADEDTLFKDFSIAGFFQKKEGRYEVYSRESFTLSWDLEVACKLELYRNHLFEKELESREKSITLTETYDGKEKIVHYYLQAEYDNRFNKSAVISIEVIPQAVPLSPAPVIHEFFTNKKNVLQGENFTLQWKVENVSEIELYRNGEAYKKINAFEKNILLSEPSEEEGNEVIENEVIFSLKAKNEAGERIESDTVLVIIDPVSSSALLPVVHEFGANKNTVRPEEKFILRWKVENATKIVLYRNEYAYKNIKIEDDHIQLIEPYDENNDTVTFKLAATNEDGGEIESGVVSVEVKSVVTPPNVPLPVVLEFTANKNSVRQQEVFQLSWKIEHATKVVLYRNGVEYKNINNQEKEISLHEYYQEGKNKVIFKLVVSNNEDQKSESGPIAIIVKPNPNTPVAAILPPVIYDFTADKTSVKHLENFTLQWRVANATKIVLYRNGSEFKKIKNDETSIQLSESYDKKKSNVIFKLVVSNDSLQQSEASIIIIIEKPSGQTTTLPLPPPTTRAPGTVFTPAGQKIIYVIVAVIIALVVIYFLVPHSKPKNTNGPVVGPTTDTLQHPADTVQRDTIINSNLPLQDTGIHAFKLTTRNITQGESLIIFGKNLPGKGLSVFFNDTRGTIRYVRKNIISVTVPKLDNNNGLVTIEVRVNQQKFQVAKDFPFKNLSSATHSSIDTTRKYLSESTSTINFIHRSDGSKLLIDITNRSEANMQDVVVFVACDTVPGNGYGDVELKKEVLNAGTIASGTKKNFPCSDALSKIYNRNFTKKRIRIQLSYK